MEIKLSQKDLAFDLKIQAAARTAGCYARIRNSWTQLGAQFVRFVLVDRPMSDKQATFLQQDAVLWALLQFDPQAEIRTAKAHFHGLSDFERQTGRAQTIANSS